MRNKTKIITLLTLLFLIIGIAAATDINNLKVPDKWESIGGGNYHETGDNPGQGSGRNMMIQKWDETFTDEFYNNVTDEDYYVFTNPDNTYNFTDGFGETTGCFETVEIDGNKYFVFFSTVDDYEIKDGKTTYDIMLEFNKLNNLKPIEV